MIGGEDSRQLILKRADEALYVVERSMGRNCGHLHDIGDRRASRLRPGVEANRLRRHRGNIARLPPNLPARRSTNCPTSGPSSAMSSAAAWQRARSFGVPLSVMHLEIDGYASIREQYGDAGRSA